jgi:hypothetical protein
VGRRRGRRRAGIELMGLSSGSHASALHVGDVRPRDFRPAATAALPPSSLKTRSHGRKVCVSDLRCEVPFQAIRDVDDAKCKIFSDNDSGRMGDWPAAGERVIAILEIEHADAARMLRRVGDPTCINFLCLAFGAGKDVVSLKTKKASHKWLAFNDFSSGGRIRTSDLRVMSVFEVTRLIDEFDGSYSKPVVYAHGVWRAMLPMFAMFFKKWGTAWGTNRLPHH